MHEPPYPVELKPYGRALLALAREREDVVCLSADLTRQCEVDLFRDELPERFVQCGMSEANMIGIAGALARCGRTPFVHSFGVFATRRPYDQIANAVAYPNLPVRIIGFMPGLSSPGGPSHQAIDDVALMRALPNVTVVDVADAVEARLIPAAIVDVRGPVYVRLKRGEVPKLYDDDHELSLERAQVLTHGDDIALVASGMLVTTCLAAARVLRECGIAVTVLAVPVLKPLDARTIRDVVARVGAVVTAENHSIIGGLGSAVAEVMAESAAGKVLRRVGVLDTFAEGSLTHQYLFEKYGLSTAAIVAAAWAILARPGPPPSAAAEVIDSGSYSPV